MRRITPDIVLTAEALSTLLAIAEGDYPAHYPFILFMADTGARIGEASALRWSHVAADLATARIVRSYSSSKHLGPTKTGLERTVEHSKRLQTALAAIKPDLYAENALVFPNALGGFIDNSNFRRHVFNKIIRRMRLHGKRITPHSLRHTFARDRKIELNYGQVIQQAGTRSSTGMARDRSTGASSCSPQR